MNCRWVLWSLLAANCWCQALGKWKMISAKSRQSSGAFAKAITYQAHAKEAPKAETWTFYVVRADGISETISQILRFDGKEYPCGDLGLEEQPATVIFARLDARTARVSYNPPGGAPGFRRREQMTLEVRVTSETGPAAENLMVFAR